MTLETVLMPEALAAPRPTLPPIAGFWRRFFAWSIDSIFLGIIGEILGWLFSSFWFRIGPYGRIVGLLMILFYFGVGNSRVWQGQTLGKRLLKIVVRDEQNQTISLKRSFLRISILVIPIIFNGWTLPVFQTFILSMLITILVFGGSLAILYTMVFNRRPRQGFHDLICKTYVVYLDGNLIDTFPASARIHGLISIGLFGVAAMLVAVMAVLGKTIVARLPLASMQTLYQTWQNDDRFFSASVMNRTIFSGRGSTTHMLQVSVWVKGQLTEIDRNRLMDELAATALSKTENIEQYDLLNVVIRSAFDLGIASGNVTYNNSRTIEVWQDRLFPPAARPWNVNILDDFSINTNGWPIADGSVPCGIERMSLYNKKLNWIPTAGSEDGCYWQEIPSKIPYVTDFDMSVDLSIASYSDKFPSQAGLVFRESDDSRGYIFVINDESRNFQVAFFRGEEWKSLIQWKTSSFILPGKMNRLKVSARGSDFTFYINGNLVGKASDISFPAGLVGVAANQYSRGIGNTFEYDNFELHALKYTGIMSLR